MENKYIETISEFITCSTTGVVGKTFYLRAYIIHQIEPIVFVAIQSPDMPYSDSTFNGKPDTVIRPQHVDGAFESITCRRTAWKFA
jgi:hypothetical protein